MRRPQRFEEGNLMMLRRRETPGRLPPFAYMTKMVRGASFHGVETAESWAPPSTRCGAGES
jgi:hypothetical protein